MRFYWVVIIALAEIVALAIIMNLLNPKAALDEEGIYEIILLFTLTIVNLFSYLIFKALGKPVFMLPKLALLIIPIIAFFSLGLFEQYTYKKLYPAFKFKYGFLNIRITTDKKSGTFFMNQEVAPNIEHGLFDGSCKFHKDSVIFKITNGGKFYICKDSLYNYPDSNSMPRLVIRD